MKAPAYSHGAARKQSLDDRSGVRQVQSEVPDPRGYSVVRIKKPEQPVRDPAQCEYILGTGALIAPQQEAISRVGGSTEQLGKRMRVTQSQIDSLPGERVQDVSRVADERYPSLCHPIGKHATQGKDSGRRERLQGAQSFVARFAHASAKRRRRKGEQIACVRFRCGPDNRDAPVGQGEIGEHTVAAKPLIRDIAMWPRAGEIGDDAELRVAPASG